VVLSFTLPSRSTRQEPLADPPAIEIYRGAFDPAGRPLEKTSTRVFYTIPGELANSYQEDGRIVFRDAIEPGELARAPGAGAGRIYAVRTRAERNRASAESNRVVVRTYAPPEPVADIRVTVAERAVALEWLSAGQDPGAGGSSVPGEYRVYRAEITPDSAAAAREDVAKATLLAPLRLLSQVAETKYRDGNFEWGHTYMYVVRRVAQFGAELIGGVKVGGQPSIEDLWPAARGHCLVVGGLRVGIAHGQSGGGRRLQDQRFIDQRIQHAGLVIAFLREVAPQTCGSGFKPRHFSFVIG